MANFLTLRAWRIAFFLCLTGVLVLSLAPATPTSLTTGWDKTNHLFGFAVLALLGLRSYPGRTATVLLALLAYGGLIEVLQSLTPYRLAEWADLLADGLGLLTGAALARLFQRKPPPGEAP